MTYIKKSMVLGLMAVSFLFRPETAKAIPIPTIGAELATQIDQLTKHIDELKKVKDQITNGIEQAKSMGDKLSMDALKNFVKGQATAFLSGGMSGLKLPKGMSDAGFSEEKLKEPENITNVIDSLQQQAGEFDQEKYLKCHRASTEMIKDLSMKNLASSLSLQQNLASGEDMKKAQEASSASDDQMQLIGANTATLKVMYQQLASSTSIVAGETAKTALSQMCQ